MPLTLVHLVGAEMCEPLLQVIIGSDLGKFNAEVRSRRGRTASTSFTSRPLFGCVCQNLRQFQVIFLSIVEGVKAHLNQ
jgi:hypothetical protein